MRFFPSSTLPTCALLLGAAVLLVPFATAPASAATSPLPPQVVAQTPTANLPATTYYQSFTGAGKTSQYHLYTSGIDRSKSVGVSFYLGGDYTRNNETPVHKPGGTYLNALAAQAREKNMVLVVPISPDKDASGDGITWWQDMDGNGDYFRALQASLVQTYGLDTSRMWFTGYSGGAEFLTYEVLADRQNWIRGGGATIVGGGGSRGMATTPSAAVRSLPITWYAGSKDVAGSTNPPTWSAQAAATQGQKRYSSEGFSKTAVKILPGVSHDDYDQVSLVREDLAKVPSATSSPSAWLQGAIKVDYVATGGASVYGQPASAERTIIGGDGAVYQPFTNGYRYYWSAQTGPAPVRMTGPTGTAFASAGYERNWGYPVNRESKLANGTYQDFQQGALRNRAMWSPTTGVHVLRFSGAIGRAWQAAGFEHTWGYLATDEYAVPGGMAQKFSNGYTVTWNRTTGKVTVARG